MFLYRAINMLFNIKLDIFTDSERWTEMGLKQLLEHLQFLALRYTLLDSFIILRAPGCKNAF